MSTLRERTRHALNADRDSRPIARGMNGAIQILILVNVVMVILESVPELAAAYGGLFYALELVSVIIFTVEYAARIWSAESRLRYIFSPLGLIDFLSIVPFYLPMLIPVDLRILRALRLMRLFRILKVGRYSRAMRVLGRVAVQTRDEVAVVFFFLIIMLVISGGLMYYAERAAQPEVFTSIPAAMWWSIVTLTTVGYGDVYPITALGKCLAAFIAVLGIGFFAIPTGIISAAFLEEVRAEKAGKREVLRCPHCGELVGILPETQIERF